MILILYPSVGKLTTNIIIFYSNWKLPRNDRELCQDKNLSCWSVGLPNFSPILHQMSKTNHEFIILVEVWWLYLHFCNENKKTSLFLWQKNIGRHRSGSVDSGLDAVMWWNRFFIKKSIFWRKHWTKIEWFVMSYEMIRKESSFSRYLPLFWPVRLL